MKLKISSELSLPIEAVTETFAILAKRGMGKTYTGAVMAEEMLKHHAQVVIADPVGVWWGLRSSADGKGEGLKIIVMGGEHGDVPLEETAGALIAEFVVETNASIVLDLGLFRKGQMVRFMTDFCEKLYHAKAPEAKRTPLHFFMDEADAFAPQKPMPEQARLLGAIQDIVRRGRARGLGVTMITQRSAVLNKDVLTQVEVLVALRTISPQDRAAVKAWIEVHADDDGQQKVVMESLPALEKGMAWFWSPGWLQILQKIKVRTRETFDSSATPEFGKKLANVKLADVDLDSLKARMAATIEKAKADDPKELRKQIAELQRQLKTQPPVDTKALEERLRGVMQRDMDVAIGKAIRDRDAEWYKVVDEFNRASVMEVRNIEEACKRLLGIEHHPPAAFTGPKLMLPAMTPQPHIIPLADRALQMSRPVQVSDSNGDGPKGLEGRILRVLAEFESLGKTRVKRVIVSARAEARGGYFNNTVGKMRTAGLIDYPGDGLIALTVEGRRQAPNVGAPLSNSEMFDSCMRQLQGLEQRIFETLYRDYPNSIRREDLEVLVSARGGYFNNTVGHLRTMEFIDYPEKGSVRCASWVFVEEKENVYA